MKKVEATVNLSVPPARALDAFTEPELLKGWWGVERCLVEKHAGGAYALAWGISDQSMQYVSCGVIKQYEPAGLLEVGNLCYFNPERAILGGMGLSVEVKSHPLGTLLRVCQDGYRSSGDWGWYYEAVKTAWPEALKRLKSFLEKH